MDFETIVILTMLAGLIMSLIGFMHSCYNSFKNLSSKSSTLEYIGLYLMLCIITVPATIIVGIPWILSKIIK